MPYYRIVVADKRAPRDGKFVERLGSYNPALKDRTTVLNVERAQYWLGTGAKPSGTVQKLLELHGFKFDKDSRLQSFTPVAEVAPKPEKAKKQSKKAATGKAAAPEAAPEKAAAPEAAKPEAPPEEAATDSKAEPEKAATPEAAPEKD